MKSGSQMRITTIDGEVFEGLVLPQSNSKRIVLKLKDGYNIGIDTKRIKSQEEQESKKKAVAKLPPVQRDPALPKIIILHVGGTIASKVDYETGGVSNLIEPDELLNMYPDLQEIANVDARFLRNMSTEDFRFAHFNVIAKEVQLAVDEGYEGIIVTTGTDLMHCGAAASHYTLQNVPIPVVFTGSQRSSDRGSSDAPNNLKGCARFIVEGKTPGVFLGLHASTNDPTIAILRGINARKMHTARRDAFKSINIPPVALVNDEVTFVQEPPAPTGEFEVKLFNEKLRIGMSYIHPQFFPEELDVYNSFDGLIIVGTGLGAAPINDGDKETASHKQIREKLKKLASKIPVVMTSQCIHGRVSLQIYSSNRRLQDMGILGHDLAFTPETAFIKLAWILSQDLSGSAMYDDFNDAIPRIEGRANE